jgi:hypothetical protein
MNRRGFLGLLTGLTAATIAAPLAKLLPHEEYVDVKNIVVGQWADYCSVSDIAFEPCIPAQVQALDTYYSQALAWNLNANMSFGSSHIFKGLPENATKEQKIKFYSYPIGDK